MTLTAQTQPAVRRGGPAPYGWEWTDQRLAPVPREQAIRWLVLHLHHEGWSLRRIGAELGRLKLPARTGLTVWSRMTLHRIVTGPAQAGDPIGSG